ncbi:hypothetical protein [Kutzneria sp. NPDC052558]|uniref:hypothetical protein n=1 Tax=Kutzneria sp. NPDC052558 TaxID=3364121 RepID=UPI0037C97D71
MTASADLPALRQRFAADMTRGVRQLAALGYDAKLFAQMLAEHGAEEAARRLVMTRVPSYGLWRLKELGKLAMSVEMWVLLPWYEPLFEPEVRQRAEDKLELLGVEVPDELARLVRRLDPEW